ncbi:MAG: hypothetical protein ABIJ34_03870 [archaeon]
MNKNHFYELFGWVGTFLILLAYGLASFGWLSAESAVFQIMNIVGSAGLLTIALVKKVYQSVVINVVWALIGLVALAKIFFLI